MKEIAALYLPLPMSFAFLNACNICKCDAFTADEQEAILDFGTRSHKIRQDHRWRQVEG